MFRCDLPSYRSLNCLWQQMKPHRYSKKMPLVSGMTKIDWPVSLPAQLGAGEEPSGSLCRWAEPWRAQTCSSAAPTFSGDLGWWGQGTDSTSHTSCCIGGCPRGRWGVMSAPMREEACCRGEGPGRHPRTASSLRRRPWGCIGLEEDLGGLWGDLRGHRSVGIQEQPAVGTVDLY